MQPTCRRCAVPVSNLPTCAPQCRCAAMRNAFADFSSASVEAAPEHERRREPRELARRKYGIQCGHNPCGCSRCGDAHGNDHQPPSSTGGDTALAHLSVVFHVRKTAPCCASEATTWGPASTAYQMTFPSTPLIICGEAAWRDQFVRGATLRRRTASPPSAQLRECACCRALDVPSPYHVRRLQDRCCSGRLMRHRVARWCARRVKPEGQLAVYAEHTRGFPYSG